MGSFAELGSESARLWRGKNEVPSAQMLGHWLEALKVPASYSRATKKNASVGDLDTACAHINSFVRNAHEELTSSFCGSERFFYVDVLQSKDSTELDILFQLKTRAVKGSTLFRTAVKRVGPDRYLYLE